MTALVTVITIIIVVNVIIYVDMLGRSVNMPAEGLEFQYRPRDLVSWQLSRDCPQSVKTNYEIMLLNNPRSLSSISFSI
jgi:hypothetical protein